jgi:hypothetical protein
MESTDLKWRKASYSSNGGGNCVEIADHGSRVMVRDTKERAGAVLRFSPDAWRRFVDRVKRSLADPQSRIQGNPSRLGGCAGPAFPRGRRGAVCAWPGGFLGSRVRRELSCLRFPWPLVAAETSSQR